MPSDKRAGDDSEAAERVEAADEEAADDQPRDPETGRFLPKEARQSDEQSAAAPDSAASRPEREAPADDSPVAESAADQRDPRPTTGPETVFVLNPGGYPRPQTVYLAALPWLRLPARPPVDGPVTGRR